MRCNYIFFFDRDKIINYPIKDQQGTNKGPEYNDLLLNIKHKKYITKFNIISADYN